MSTPRQRFNKSLKEQRQRFGVLSLALRDEIVELLQAVLANIQAGLSKTPSAFAQSHLPKLKREVEAALRNFQTASADDLRRGVINAWQLGQDLVTAPLAAAAAIQLSPVLSNQILVATQVFLTEKIADITAAMRRAVDAELGLMIAGARSGAEAINAISVVIGSERDRALTIVRTEVGRVYAAATQATLEHAEAMDVPGIKKQWRRSGKITGRETHNAADGQVRNVRDAFSIGGEAMNYPRDPKASAKNTINCGCTLLPYVADWDVLYKRRAKTASFGLAETD